MGLSELDAMKSIDEALLQIESAEIRDRILRWAWSKFSSSPNSSSLTPHAIPPTTKTHSAKKAKPSKRTAKPKTGLCILKELNLKPKDKQSFADFAREKDPQTDAGKCLVAIYYMQHILEIQDITTNHVFTCFKVIIWRIPANLENRLQVIASTKGWLDTSDMSNIRTTHHGDNHIEHDLPKDNSKQG